MDLYNLSPLILAHCIEYLRERPINTKYHPSKGKYFLDGKLMARIIRHKGDLRASISNGEAIFFGKVVKTLIHNEFVESPIKNEVFEVKENNNFHKLAINVYDTKRMLPLRGKVVKLRSEKYEPIHG